MALFKYYAGAMVPDPFTFNQASGQYSANPTSAGRLGIMDQDLAYALDQKGYSMAMMTAQYSGDFDPGKVIVQAGSLSPQIVSDLMDLGEELLLRRARQPQPRHHRRSKQFATGDSRQKWVRVGG